MGRRKRRRVDPTHEWEQIELLCVWNEQRDYVVSSGDAFPYHKDRG